MSLMGNILSTYRKPRQVVAGLLAMGEREDRLLALLMGSVAVAFVAQWPRLAREAYLTDTDLQMLLGGALLGLVFIFPLFVYVLGGASHLALRLMGGRGTNYGTRLALVWALVAAMPLMLLHGLTAGFVGPGVAKAVVGFFWFAAFGTFWISGLIEVEWGAGARAKEPSA